MKMFYKKGRSSIVLMLVLTMLLQIVGPVVGDFVYAMGEEEGFKVTQESPIEDGKVTIDWKFTLDLNNSKDSYEYSSNFTLKEGKESQALIGEDENGNEVEIGRYRISEDGKITVDIHEELYEVFEEVVEPEIEEVEKVEESDTTTENGGKTDREEEQVDEEQIEEDYEVKTISFSGSFDVEGVVEKVMLFNISSEEEPVSFKTIELEHVDSTGNPVSGDFKIDSHVKIKFSYSISDGAQVDATKIYDFKIPEEIKIIADQNLELKDGDRVLANVSIKTDGMMTVQFLDEINNENFEDDREGWIIIESQFDETKLSDGGDKTIRFDVDGVSKDVNVKFEEIVKTENVTLEKWGSYDTSKNEITWIVRVEPTTNPKGRTIENIVITDIIQAGQTYIAESAELDGTKIIPDPVTGNTLSYTFNELNDGSDQTITFKTKAEITQFVNQGDTIEFKNTVTGTFGKDNEPTNSSEDKVTTTVDFIKKTGEEKPGEGKIEWTIEVNNNNLELPAGIEIKDTMGDGLEYNNDLLIDGKAPTEYGTLSIENRVFTFIFTNPINTKHTLTYSTNVTDSGAYDSNDEQTYKNKAEITWTGKPGGSTNTGDISVGVSTNVISKSGAGYNRPNHEVTWKIVVNSNKIKIKSPIVTDKLPDTLEYVSHAIDGNKTWNFTNDNNNLSFSHSGDINETYTITLVTKIKDVHKDHFGNNSTKIIKNTAELTGDGVKYSTSTGEQEIESEVTKKTAEGYDYIKRKASWKIVVNQNKMLITDAIVTDEIQGEFHKFVEGSLMIDGVPITEGYEVNGNTITINLGTITGQKTITFETQIPKDKVEDFFKENGDKKLKNNSTLTGDEIKDGGVKSDATQKVENTVVSKEGKYTNGNDFIDWEVIINSNKLELKGVELEDTLQEGLILDDTTVEVKELTIKSDGKHEESKGRSIITDYDRTNNKVTFNIGDIEDAYILRFRTDVDDNYNNTNFANKIKLKGSNGEQTGTSTSIGISWQTGSAGGSGTSTRGSLTVKKVDKEVPDNIIHLEGSGFKLLDKDQKPVKNSENGDYIISTDSEGIAVFENLRMGKYYIKEIKAPIGYILDEELKEVELKKGADTKHITYEFKNEKIKGNIEFNKKDEQNNPLEGAEFSIYNEADKNVEDAVAVKRASSDINGLVKFEDIPYGKYIIKETIAPVGYEPSEKLLEVEIKENGERVTLEEVVNERIIGDIEIIKKSESGETLKDAEFELRNNNNENKVYTGITDKNGSIVFKDIDHGTYTLKETKPPKGHILNKKTYEVEISKYNQKPIRITVVNQKIKGKLEILKVDSRTNRPLGNARFTLYDRNMQKVVETSTDGDGKAIFENLVYGKYFYEETKAPSGYYRNETVYELNVPENEGEILENGFVIDRVVENTRRPYYPPTGPERPTDPKPPVVPPTDPTKPVDPVEPTEPEDPVEIQEVPKDPNDPTIKEETPKDTPKEGEVEVPEGSTPKITTPPTNGTVTIDPNGKWTYTPNPGFVGKDSFTMTITHPDGTEEEIFVEIDVDEPPLGNIEAGGSTPEETVKTLPKTGSIGRLGFYISGLLFIILGIFIVRRKTE